MEKIGLNSNYLIGKTLRVNQEGNSGDQIIEDAVAASLPQYGRAFETSVLDVLAMNNHVMLSANNEPSVKIEYTKDELFYMGFTSYNYFEKVNNEDGTEDLYRLKSGLVIQGISITSVDQLKELLGLVSIDEFLGDYRMLGDPEHQSGRGLSLSVYHDTFIGADIQCTTSYESVDDDVPMRQRTLLELLTYLANDNYDDWDLHNRTTNELYSVVALFNVIGIQQGENEDSIRQKLNEYLKSIGGTTEDGVNYKVDGETMLRALYRDSEDFRRRVDSLFLDANNEAEKNALAFDIPYEEYYSDICNGTEISVQDFEAYWSGGDTPEFYNILAMKNIEKFAGITENDTIEQKRAKMQAFLDKVKESMFMQRGYTPAITPDMIELYALQNGLVKQRTYSEEDLQFLLDSGKIDSLEQCFDKIQNEDGSYSYQLKHNLTIYRTYFEREHNIVYSIEPKELVSMYDEVSTIDNIDNIETLCYWLGIPFPENDAGDSQIPSGETNVPKISRDKQEFATFELKKTELINLEASFENMRSSAQKYGLIASPQKGLYYLHQGSDEYAFVWNPVQSKFNSIAIKVISPNGVVTRDFTRSGKAVNKSVSNIYSEALLLAYTNGYHPTSKIGVFEKDGNYYKYDSDRGIFKEFE